MRKLIILFLFLFMCSIANATELRKTFVTDEATGDTAQVFTMSDTGDNLDEYKGLVAASAIYGRYSDTGVAPIKIDQSTFDIQAIEHEHAEIHSGDHYFVCGYDPDMDAAEDVDFQVLTPNTTKWLHMTFNIQSTGETVFTIYEDVNFDMDGATITPMNNDRNSLNTSDSTMQTGGTVISSTTVIYQAAFGYAATPSRVIGGSVERNRELILKQGTKYRFFIESNTADNIVSYCGEWYEHTNRK